MAETTTAASAPAKKATKKPKAKPAHPKTSQMVGDAIKALKDRKGSSLAAIKKHIVANNKVDADKIAPFIRRYIKKAVADGTLVQTKGTGANGSFKLAAAAKPVKPKAPKKKSAATPTKKKATKKSATPKKKATKKAATPKKKVKKTATKSKKEKKPSKSPKKPKAPKPKKAATKPKAKKAAPKKK